MNTIQKVSIMKKLVFLHLHSSCFNTTSSRWEAWMWCKRLLVQFSFDNLLKSWKVSSRVLLVMFYNFIIRITIFRWLLFYRLLFTWSAQEQYSTIPICCPIIRNPSRNVWKICLQWSGVHLACCAVMVNACKPSVQSSVIIHVTYTRGSCDSQFPGSRFAETLDVSLLLYQITPFVFLVTFTLHLQDKRQRPLCNSSSDFS